jgi:hypothetical protein
VVEGPPLVDSDAAALSGFTKMIVAGAVAMAGTAGPVVAGASAALAVPATYGFEYMIGRWRRAAAERTRDVTMEAIGASGLSEDAFVEDAAADSARLGLMQRVYVIAASSDYNAKLRLVARAWAEAVRDPTRVESASLRLASLRDIEAAHTVVLAQLATSEGGQSRRAIVEALPLYASVIDPVLQTLLASGLAFAGGGQGVSLGDFMPVSMNSSPDDVTWHITKWGSKLLAELEAALQPAGPGVPASHVRPADSVVPQDEFLSES